MSSDNPSPPDVFREYESWDDCALLHDRRHPDLSFAVFYRRHVETLLRLAARSGLDVDTAADVVAETFFAALVQRRKYRATHASALPWLVAIARRKRVDEHRRRGSEDARIERLRHEVIGLTAVDRDDFELLREEECAALRELDALPPLQRAAIAQRVIEEREYGDIANRLGLSEPAARQRVSRGLSVLRNRVRRAS